MTRKAVDLKIPGPAKFQPAPLCSLYCSVKGSVDQGHRVVSKRWAGIGGGDDRVLSSRAGVISRGAVRRRDHVRILQADNRAGEGWERPAYWRSGVIGLDGQWRRIYGERSVS